MSGALDQLRQSTHDLERLGPLSDEVRKWLDQAYDTLKEVDVVESAILRLHERSLRDPERKAVASSEIVETIDRARATDNLMQRMGVQRRAV